MNEDISNNKLFKAFWHYCLNHARVRYDGDIEINFVIENRDDFIQKINSRLYSRDTYGVVNATEVYNESVRIRELYEAHKRINMFYKRAFWEIYFIKIMRAINRWSYPKIFKIDYPYLQAKKFGINPLKSAKSK